MRAEGSKLNRKQEAVIAALLIEPTHEAAALKCGISEATVQRWLHLPEFKAAYRAARAEVLEQTISRLVGATAEALETLRALLSCDKASVRATAALGILDRAARGVELLDVLERLEALEARAAGRKAAK
jgi:hypothetical protein